MVGFSFFPRRRKSIGNVRIRSFTFVFVRSVLFYQYSLVHGSLPRQKKSAIGAVRPVASVDASSLRRF